MRKIVPAECYNGDVSHLRKLSREQLDGRNRLKNGCSINLPYDAFLYFLATHGSDISRPAEFLIDSTGTVRCVTLTDSIAVRASPARILKAVVDIALASRPREVSG